MRRGGPARSVAALVVAGLAMLILASCSRAPPFRIVAGSEQKSLEPLVQQFCAQRHVECQIDYKGSLDIGLMLAGDQTPTVDAVWPASSLWIEIYDKNRRVKDLKSIASSPVILGVRMSKARALGWTNGKPVRMDDILAAVQAGKLTYLMTSATQSNSGASAYLAMLAAAFGDGGRLEPRALDDEGARSKVRELLKGVARSSGSSGWLKDLYLSAAKDGRPFDAMWNYEAVLKETNDALRQQGGELLYAVYPADGVGYADAPLGYVDHGQPPATRTFFADLQAYMLSPAAQAKVAEDGRRTAPGMAAQPRPDAAWNFDPARVVPSIALPEPEVISRALVLYQEVLRRPSLTAICLDFSGSMQGQGETQLQNAMAALLTPQTASLTLIQWTPGDRIIVIPFDATPRDLFTGDGSAASQSQLLAKVRTERAGGGTDMYACAHQALAAMTPYIGQGYLPAIVIMTDGRSQGGEGFASEWEQSGHDIPIFGVTFGDADKSQLQTLAERTHARVFDGGTNLTEAFRSARGYN